MIKINKSSNVPEIIDPLGSEGKTETDKNCNKYSAPCPTPQRQ